MVGLGIVTDLCRSAVGSGGSTDILARGGALLSCAEHRALLVLQSAGMLVQHPRGASKPVAVTGEFMENEAGRVVILASYCNGFGWMR